MDTLGLIASILYQFGTNAAFLLISAIGLIVILGMMRIINLAHGELMMMGAYTATIAFHRGIPFPIAAIIAFIVVAVAGAILERLIVKRFYGRELGARIPRQRSADDAKLGRAGGDGGGVGAGEGASAPEASV